MMQERSALWQEAGQIYSRSDVDFSADPLQVLCAARMAAQQGCSVAEQTVLRCRGGDLSQLLPEQVEQQLILALLGKQPSAFFAALRRMEQLDLWFPEVRDLIGVEQSPIHHAEGDVWNHTMMVLDEAALYRDKAQDPAGFMLGALMHDFGKVVCTEVIDGQIHAYDHEIQGLPLAERFLGRFPMEESRVELVLNLVRYHMQPNALAAQNSSVKATNRLLDRAIDPLALIYVAVADGRGKFSTLPYVSYEHFLLERLQVYGEYMQRPHVTREDLIAAGMPETMDFTEALEYAHKLRLAGVDLKEALGQTLSLAKKNLRTQQMEKAMQP